MKYVSNFDGLTYEPLVHSLWFADGVSSSSSSWLSVEAEIKFQICMKKRELEVPLNQGSIKNPTSP